MATKLADKSRAAASKRYRGADIPRRAIASYAQVVAERFSPDRIVLFGSHAYGKPTADSDVDLLIVIPTSDELSKAAQIEFECEPPFPADIIVRTPENLSWRIEEGEAFHTEILSKGLTLHEKGDARMGEKGRNRLPRRKKNWRTEMMHCTIKRASYSNNQPRNI